MHLTPAMCDLAIPELSAARDMLAAADVALAAEDLHQATLLFRRAEAAGCEPDHCAGGRWMAAMLGGDFEAAWRESDAIRARGAPDPHRFWNGEDFEGKRIILRCLHGFGDAVQMLRFLPRLQQRAAEVIVEVPPRLRDLAPCFCGMGEVITWGEAAPVRSPQWDLQIEVMELPYALRVSSDDLQPTSGYLQLSQEVRDRARIASRVDGRPRVGVVWTAGAWNPSRSVPYAAFSVLLETQDVEFWSLQGGADQLAWTGERDAREFGEGVATLAAVIDQMDLVITVDTLAAHLAGALDVPCWVLLQRSADWRWMSRRENTPWYPSLRLLRQQVAGDWVDLMKAVMEELKLWREEFSAAKVR